MTAQVQEVAGANDWDVVALSVEDECVSERGEQRARSGAAMRDALSVPGPQAARSLDPPTSPPSLLYGSYGVLRCVRVSCASEDYFAHVTVDAKKLKKKVVPRVLDRHESNPVTGFLPDFFRFHRPFAAEFFGENWSVAPAAA